MATSKFNKPRLGLCHALTAVNRPLHPDDVAKAAVYMLDQPMGVSVKAMDVVPSGQLSFCEMLSWFGYC
jgi:NADP-dependent 3-hydroxy acid dehydrogenase YdfG